MQSEDLTDPMVGPPAGKIWTAPQLRESDIDLATEAGPAGTNDGIPTVS